MKIVRINIDGTMNDLDITLKKKKSDFGFDLVDIDYKEPKPYKKKTRK